MAMRVLLLFLCIGLVMGGPVPYWGGHPNNDKYYTMETTSISSANIALLEERCRVDTSAGLTPIPGQTAGLSGIGSISHDGIYYITTWNGYLLGIRLADCEVMLNVTVATVTGVENDISRTTPIIDGDYVIIGNGQGITAPAPYTAAPTGAWMVSVNRHTGMVRWQTQVESHPAAVITGSGTLVDGVIYGGISSLEEILAAFIPGYACCSFRGSVFALDAATGEFVWANEKAYTVPDVPGISGNAVWGSGPSVDVVRGLVYFASGNNYNVTQEIVDCLDALPVDATKAATDACLGPENLVNAVFAVSIDTGAVVWANRLTGPDSWTMSCLIAGLNPENCPTKEGPDWDNAQAPIITPITVDGVVRDAVCVGQKSGILWCLDADTGAILDAISIGEGGALGGFMWGMSKDDDRFYVSNYNGNYLNYTLPDGRVICTGIIAAVSATDMTIDWARGLDNAVFDGDCPGFQAGPTMPGARARFVGSTVVTNDLAWYGDDIDTIYAMKKETGAIVRRFNVTGTVNAAPSAFGDCVAFLGGYARFGAGTNQPYVRVYCIPPSSPEGLSGGAIVVIVIGAIVACGLIAVILYDLVRSSSAAKAPSRFRRY